ncbi:MAG: MoxR family ATPase [Elusimicrobia bacterium]|nr:MoxR family ATPase [Candidatus Obscuribacterium magneticum]
MSSTQPSDLELAQKVTEAHQSIKGQIAKVIVGQNQVIDELLLAIFVQGHCLIVGVPGLAKTLLVSTLSKTLDLEFNRVQFTPDLMPSDITGTEVIQEDKVTRERVFKFIKGPIFANVVLADEINRTPPKTQAALLQAMQERKVTVGGQTYPLPEPFFVLATQNPIEQEGTYPLPEAQLDRFLFQINIGYPSFDEEKVIVEQTTKGGDPHLKAVLNAAEIKALQDIVRRVPIADTVIDYAVRLARATRPTDSMAPDFIKTWVAWGAGPRAPQSLILGAKARALLNGHPTPSVEDVRAILKPALRHRIVLSFQAEAEGMTTDKILTDLLKEVPE